MLISKHPGWFRQRAAVLLSLLSFVARGKREKSTVLRGRKTKVTGALQQNNLMRSKVGRIVSKQANANGKIAYVHGKIAYVRHIALQQARQALGVTGGEERSTAPHAVRAP